MTHTTACGASSGCRRTPAFRSAHRRARDEPRAGWRTSDTHAAPGSPRIVRCVGAVVYSARRSRPAMTIPLLRTVLRLARRKKESLVERLAPVRGRARERFEGIVASFFDGYDHALAVRDVPELQEVLESRPPGTRGFSWEGAAMALRLLDAFTSPHRRRIPRLLEGAGARHEYLIHVGIGWAHAQLPGRIERGLGDLDPLLRPLALDGYGFHAGLFRTRRFHEQRARPRLGPEGLRSFDQGLGRSLWFVGGLDVQAAATRLAGFAPERRPDLWSGLGLAVAYAGGASEGELGYLLRASGADGVHFLQGVAFAATARARAEDWSRETDAACRSLLAAEPPAVARRVEELRLAHRGTSDAYERWRAAVRADVLNGEPVVLG